ncbi:hypothetical protein D3C71_1823280 [compost metagenome]
MKIHTPEGVERLRTLYSVMAGVPTEKVYMSCWRTSSAGDDRLIGDCGTSACAIGWACAYPEFQEQGLGYDTHAGVPSFQGNLNWHAVMSFFGVSESTADHLFQTDEQGLVAKRGVLRRIRKLLLENGVITEERSGELVAMEQALTA